MTGIDEAGLQTVSTWTAGFEIEPDGRAMMVTNLEGPPMRHRPMVAAKNALEVAELAIRIDTFERITQVLGDCIGIAEAANLMRDLTSRFPEWSLRSQ